MTIPSPSVAGKGAASPILPDSWDCIELRHFTPRGRKNAIVDGPFGSNLKTEHYRSSGIPIVTSGFVTDGVFKARSYLYVDEDKFNKEKRSAVYPGDIVMAKIGARCGASAILPYNHPVGILSGNALKISIDATRHSTAFVASVLGWLYERGELDVLRSIGAQPAMSMPLLKRLQLPAPPLAEQHAIVRLFEDVDATIRSLEALIAKKHAIKQGMMQQLLTGKTRLPGFTEPWKSAAFQELAAPVRERTAPRAVSPKTRLVELEHIESGGGRLLSSATAPSAVSLKTVFRRGDVLFGKLRAYLRKYWLADSSGICSTEIWVLRAKPAAYGDYIRYLVETDRFIEVASGGYGTHMPRSDWGMLRNLEFEAPSLEEQKAIASILRDIDNEIDLLHDRLTKAKAVKQGIMQELLTGRTRLPIVEAAS